MAKNKLSLDEHGPQMPGGFRLPETSGAEGLWAWLKENFSSVILPILAVVVLAAGIYFYSTGRTLQNIPTDNIKATATAGAPTETSAAEQQEYGKSGAKPEVQKPAAASAVVSGDVITETAQPGNGVTHLARRALKDYLANHSDAPTLTKEHKIFIEDYLKDKTGSQPLEIGQKLSFPTNLVSEAIAASQHLSPQQLKHLSIYAARVISI